MRRGRGQGRGVRVEKQLWEERQLLYIRTWRARHDYTDSLYETKHVVSFSGRWILQGLRSTPISINGMEFHTGRHKFIHRKNTPISRSSRLVSYFP